MKANELRIENWVNNNEEDYQITSATIVQLERGDSIALPIQLTEQWLKLFGLTKPYNDKYGAERTFPYKMLDGFIKQRNGVYFFKHGTLEVELPYVHTLQNLYYALKNEELTLSE